jgi:outer membrane lipase/esterase
MMLKKAALAGASLLCLTYHAHAQNFNKLVAFGDSTTDTGWFANASPVLPDNPFAPLIREIIQNSLANGGNAHFTGPGPGNAQILGSFFGLPANPANTPGGTNYAIGGAFNDAILGPGLENLFSTTFGQANTNLPGTDRQIGNYLASVNGHANPNALYLISSGGNNAFYASMTFGSDAAAANAAFLLPEAQALANAVAQLQQAGARYIIVANQYQPPSADANAVIYGNTVINATFADLTRAGVKFITANTASVIAAVEQNPLAFGITAPISSNACNFPGFTKYRRRHLCQYHDATTTESDGAICISGVCRCHADAPVRRRHASLGSRPDYRRQLL